MTEKNKKAVVHVDPDLEEIIPRFMEIRQEDIQEIDEALEMGDFDRVRRIGHSMKGAGGSYGFTGVSKIGAAIERAAREQKPDEIKRQVQELVHYLENIEIVFDG